MNQQREETINGGLAFEEYKSKYYEKLKGHKLKVKFLGNSFICPYCYESREYTYKDLCRHASRIARESRSASLKEKAKHMALEEFLEMNFDDDFKNSGSTSKITDLYENNKEELVVWPSMALVANIPVELKDDSYLDDGFLGDIAKNLKDGWMKQGYKPVNVYPLWSCLGHSGFAVVEFGKEWDGFNDANLFVKDLEADKHGRNDWYDSKRCKEDKLYAWIAKDEDYYSNGLVGAFLRKNGVLKSLSEIKKEKEVKNPTLLLASVIKQKDMLIDKFNEDFKKLQKKANEIIEQLQIKLQLEDHEKKMNEIAMSEQKKAYDRLLKLAYDHKRENENLQKKIIDNQEEINQLKEAKDMMQNLIHENVEEKKKTESIQKDLKKKEKEIEELKELNHALLVKENSSTGESDDDTTEFLSLHTRKRKLLAQERSNDMVFQSEESDDPIMLNGNYEWFMRGLENNGEDEDLMFVDDDLTWGDGEGPSRSSQGKGNTLKDAD